LFAVVFSALLGQFVLLKLYRIYPVTEVAPWMLLVPFFAGLSAIMVYGESISYSLFLGGAIVLFGVWIQQSRSGRTPGGAPPI
jgi:drug/metabolite transporter (DMT)-like permease